MNEADMLFVGGIEKSAYDLKLEIKLLYSFVDMEIRDEDLKEIIMQSLLRMEKSNTQIFSAIEKIKSEEYI